jgi:hypothetical protein
MPNAWPKGHDGREFMASGSDFDRTDDYEFDGPQAGNRRLMIALTSTLQTIATNVTGSRNQSAKA